MLLGTAVGAAVVYGINEGDPMAAQKKVQEQLPKVSALSFCCMLHVLCHKVSVDDTRGPSHAAAAALPWPGPGPRSESMLVTLLCRFLPAFSVAGMLTCMYQGIKR